MIVATLMGIIAAAVLLLAGYIFGAKRGRQIRENLEEQLSYQQAEASKYNTDTQKKIDALMQRSDTLNRVVKPLSEWDTQVAKLSDVVQEQLSYQQEEANKANADTEKKIDALIQQSDALHRVVEPLAEWDAQVEKLGSVVKDLQASASQKDQVALGLTTLETTAKHRGDLTRLMDDITEKAHFETVLLSDENGLPVAANSAAKDLERLAAISSFVLIFGDRLTQHGAAAPLSYMVHDTENKEMLCRIFHIGNQRFVLTAISIGLQLTSTALDPTLPKVTRILSAGNW